MSYRPPAPLGPAHELDTFTCSSAEQTDWLKRHARQSTATGTTKVFVVTEADGRSVVAYYAWTMAQITVTDAPTRLRKGGGNYPQPVALLARLGVHRVASRGWCNNDTGRGSCWDVMRRLRHRGGGRVRGAPSLSW